MNKPQPKPIDPAELVKLATAVVAEDRFPMLATIDGNLPRVRPVSPVRTDRFTIYVANLRSYHKTQEIEANPYVELCYLSGAHDQVRIAGRAEVVTERPLLEEIWNENPLLRQYLGTIDNPELIIYRIRPFHVRYMREWALEYHVVSPEEMDAPAELIERELLTAMRAQEPTDRPVKCDVVLRLALQAVGFYDEACEDALCNGGSEEPRTRRFYDALRQLIEAGLAEGRGDLRLPAGPRYTECRITPAGIERLEDWETGGRDK